MPTTRFRYLLLSILLISFWSTISAKEYSFRDEKVYAVGENPRLELNYHEGNVEISSHDIDRVVIRTTRRVNAVGMEEGRKIADNMVMKVERERSSLIVNTGFMEKPEDNPSFWNKLLGTAQDNPNGAIDFEILVPENCDVVISNNTGAMRLSNLRGSIDLRSSSSDIQLNTIEGEVTVNNASGNTTGDLIYGPVMIHQPMGKIELNWIEGDIKIKSSSASISIKQERGAVDLISASGSVDVRTNLLSSRDNFISTESGDVNLVVSRSASASLDIASDLGNVKTDIPITITSVSGRRLVGEFGDRGVTIHVTSSTGDVSVAQY